MGVESVTALGTESIRVILLASAPLLLVGLGVGLVVSIFQATTQINEMTLTFIPKMLAIYVSAIFFSSWIMELLISFTRVIFSDFSGALQ